MSNVKNITEDPEQTVRDTNIAAIKEMDAALREKAAESTEDE